MDSILGPRWSEATAEKDLQDVLELVHSPPQINHSNSPSCLVNVKKNYRKLPVVAKA